RQRMMRMLRTTVLLALASVISGCFDNRAEKVAGESAQEAPGDVAREEKIAEPFRKTEQAAGIPVPNPPQAAQPAEQSLLAVPSESEQAAPQHLVDEVRRLFEKESKASISMDSTVPTQRDFAALRHKLVHRVYVDAFERRGDKNASWHGPAEMFIARAID